MRYKILPILALILVGLIMFGCSGSNSGGNPVTPSNPQNSGTPDLTGAKATSANRNYGHCVWGYWQGSIDPETGEVELAGIRDVLFHVNIVSYLQSPLPPGLEANINSFNATDGLVDLDLTIKHPFPNSNLRGFDVRGIIMGSGATYTGKFDPTLKFTDPTGFRILNADGYTRWWNASEFTSAGLYGFVPGDLGPKFFIPQANLNGYKYYADVLGPSDPVVPNVNINNRGTFSTDGTPPELTRNYLLKFPFDGQGNPVWLFQYAIDASWAPPTGGSPKPKPIDDYPIEANMPEAFNIEVSTVGTTAWFQDESNRGGDLRLRIEVFDWGAPSNPGGINAEVGSIKIESPDLFDNPVNVPLSPSPGSQVTSGIYNVVVYNVHPSSLDNQEVLVTVNSSDPTTYEPPASGPVYPVDASLAAYALVEIPISEEPPTPAVLTVTSPNGGESLEAGGLWEITWTSEGPVGPDVKIEYSQQDEYFTEITPSTENDGSFIWDPLPDIDRDDLRVVITSVSNPTVMDQSDEYFEITTTPDAQIVVTSPNGGEEYYSGGSTTVTWDTIGPVGPTVSISYEVAGGPTAQIASGEANDGEYQWEPIPNLDSDQVKIVVQDESAINVMDKSDDYFSVKPGKLTLIEPNGGEIWLPGSAESIEWESVGDDVGFEVALYYTISDGPENEITPATDNDGSYMLTPVPDVDSNEVRILVRSLAHPEIEDASDDYFSITSNPEPTIVVTRPNGGELWEAGTTEEITWESYGLVGPEVRIDYVVQGSPAVNIVSQTDNDGSYMWDPIPDINSDSVKIVIFSVINPSVYDESDDFFTIHTDTWLEITSPNGGEVLTGVDPWTITWNYDGAIDSVDIWYSTEEGDGFPYPIKMFAPNTGFYEWDPVDNVDTTEGKIRIYSSTEPGIEDFSDDYFTINSVPQDLTLTAPNGGEAWTIGGSGIISWSSQNLWGDIDIYYTVADSEDPVLIVDDAPDTGSYEWTDIPGPATSEARVTVISDYYPTIRDSSDDFFSINEPNSLMIVSPDGGESLVAGEQWSITWDSTGTITNVNLYLSADSGSTYDTDIILDADNNGSYQWDPVPELDTNTCRIKIEDASDPGTFDESDGDFSIHPGGPATGWLPIEGLTQIPFPAAAPDQDPEVADIAVYSDAGLDDKSRAFICTQTDTPDITFSLYDDLYSDPVLTSWEYPYYAMPINKFDTTTDGNFLFVINSNSDSFPNETVNDPFYCAFTACNVVDGEYSDGFWHLYGDTGDPDPDDAPWRRVADVSSGVTGGIDDTTFYYLTVIADHPDQPQPHDGNILLSTWSTPYDQDGFINWLVNSSVQGGGDGFVDDTVPTTMALAVDDDTDLVFGSEPAQSFWVLGSDGRITAHLLAPSSGDVAVIDNQLDSEEYGTAVPVDIECAPAKAFDYSVGDPNPFNWLCVLLDNGDGTWSVGVWECDFLAGPPAEYHLIDITEPLDGTPQALDVDGTDFEIHVLADNGGEMRVTVFEYIPE